jgi:FMN phosphatase YigB (HAD superfamily)
MERLYSPEEIRRIHDSWLLHEYFGVAAVVESLHRAGTIETALLSNTNHAHWKRQAPECGLPHFPTAGTLRYRLASHLERCAKPGEAFYRLLEQRTGARGCEILFFDDLEENIRTARSLGWRAEKIDHLGDTAEQIRICLARHSVL